MIHRLARSLILACLVPLAACAGGADPMGSELDLSAAPATERASIRTGRTQYQLRKTGDVYEAAIGLTYTNPTGGTVYMPTCMGPTPPALEKWEGGKWVMAYAPATPRCLGPPLVIQPGESYDYTLEVVAGVTGSNTYPQFQVEEIPGIYRLSWGFLRTWTPNGPEPRLGEPLPKELGLSNVFGLTL